MSEINEICDEITERLKNSFPSVKNSDLVILTDHIKALDKVFQQLLKNAYKRKDHFSYNAAKFSDEDSWEAYHQSCEMIIGIMRLNDAYYSLIKNLPEKWVDKNKFLSGIIAWLEKYDLNHPDQSSYEKCNNETFGVIKKRVIAALEQGDIKVLEVMGFTHL